MGDHGSDEWFVCGLRNPFASAEGLWYELLESLGYKLEAVTEDYRRNPVSNRVSSRRFFTTQKQRKTRLVIPAHLINLIYNPASSYFGSNYFCTIDTPTINRASPSTRAGCERSG